MGKVYEALKRAKVEDKPAGWHPLAAEHPSSREFQPGNKTNSGHKLDFVNYSLNAADAFEIEQQNVLRSEAEASRKSLVKPAREVHLDSSRLEPQLISFHDSFSNATDEYNKLAETLIAKACEYPLKRVLVASAQPAEGRSSITLNLACSLTRAKRRVLIVDTDLRGHSLLRLLGLGAEARVAVACAGGAEESSSLIRIQPFGFDVLNGREAANNSAKPLATLSFDETLELFDPEYDFILVDSSPLLAATDSNLSIRHTDATVLVIRSGKTTSGQIEKAIARLVPEKILGVVLNRADPVT